MLICLHVDFLFESVFLSFSQHQYASASEQHEPSRQHTGAVPYNKTIPVR